MNRLYHRHTTPIRQIPPLKSHRKNYSTDISSTSSKPILTPTKNKFEAKKVNEREKISKSTSQCQSYLMDSRNGNGIGNISRLKSPIYSSKSIIVQHQLAACRMLEATLDLAITRVNRKSISEIYTASVNADVRKEKIAEELIKSKNQMKVAKIFSRWAIDSRFCAVQRKENAKIESFRRRILGKKLIIFIRNLNSVKSSKRKASAKSEKTYKSPKKTPISQRNSVESKPENKKSEIKSILKKEINSQKHVSKPSNVSPMRKYNVKPKSTPPKTYKGANENVGSMSTTPRSPFKKMSNEVIMKEAKEEHNTSFGTGNENHVLCISLFSISCSCKT